METDRLGDIGEYYLYFSFTAFGLSSLHVSPLMLFIPDPRKGKMGLGCGRSGLDLLFVVSRLFPNVATASSQGVDPFLLKGQKHRPDKLSIPLIEMAFLFYTDSGF